LHNLTIELHLFSFKGAWYIWKYIFWYSSCCWLFIIYDGAIL